jgi:heterotetrameric sarcosine oxidase gamma subunit
VRLNDASELSKVVVKGGSHTNLATQLRSITPGRSVLRGTVRIGSVRPTEWLYLGPVDAVAAAVADLDLTGNTAVTDVTHARAAIRITGRAAVDFLTRCCSLDFDALMFPDEAMATASVAAVRCDILRNDIVSDRSYLLIFDRSYAHYLTGILSDIAAEFEG